jgi:hypothetical protein
MWHQIRWLALPLMGTFLYSCGSTEVITGLLSDPPDWTGTYTVEGQWDLSGPFSDGQTVGGVVAGFVLDEVIGLVGVPDLLQEAAQEVLAESMGAGIADFIDGQLPPALAPDGPLVEALSLGLGSVAMESDLVLEEGTFPGSVEGKETFSALTYWVDGISHRLTPADLQIEGVSLEAEWSGNVAADDRLEIDPHPVELQYGQLVLTVALALADELELQAIQEDLASALDCTTLVPLVFGDEAGIELDLVGFTHEIDEDDLISGCVSAQGLIGERVLGLFALDTKVEVGGGVRLVDADGNGVVEEIESAAGHGGHVNVVPEPFAPNLSVSFTATR